MRTIKSLLLTAALLAVGNVGLFALSAAPAYARTNAATSNFAVGPQYDTTHVYVAPEDFGRFVSSLEATFGEQHDVAIGVEPRWLSVRLWV